MSRYFDPICEHLHNLEDLPQCRIHGVNHCYDCEGCQQVAGLTPCGRTS